MDIVNIGDILLVQNLSNNILEEYRIMPTFLKCEIKKFGLYNKNEYKITEYSDADINNNEISANTEFAKNAINKTINDIFVVNGIKYKVLEIHKKEDIYAQAYSALLNEDIIKEEDKNDLLDKLHTLIRIIKQNSNGECNFYHQTNFSNLKSILDCKNIYSRKNCLNKGIHFNDYANKKVINHTTKSVLNYVRFYFRPKNATYFLSEGIRGGKIKPCFIVFNNSIIFNGKYNIIMTNKNASCKDFKYNSIYNENGINNILNYDWKNIYNMSFDYNDIYEKQISCAEILIEDKVSIDDISKIIFRTHGDLMLFKHLYPENKIKLEVNQDLFFNTNSHYITSNFELKSFNQYSTLEIEYLAIPKTRNQEIKIHLKDSIIKTIRNFDMNPVSWTK